MAYVKVAELIVLISQCEKQTEQLRQILALQSKFEPYTAFRRLDRSRCGEVFQQDIMDFMESNNQRLSNLEASYLFHFLDHNHDGKITYTDGFSFAKQVLPKNNLKLREEATLRDSYFINANQTLPLDIEWALQKLFLSELTTFKELESFKREIQTLIMEAFSYIDSLELGFFQQSNLQQFLKEQLDIMVDQDSLKLFFQVYDSENRMTFPIFNRILAPFHPEQILRDRERAYYSTPKKYRRKIDKSPKQFLINYIPVQVQQRITLPHIINLKLILRIKVIFMLLLKKIYRVKLILYFHQNYKPKLKNLSKKTNRNYSHKQILACQNYFINMSITLKKVSLSKIFVN